MVKGAKKYDSEVKAAMLKEIRKMWREHGHNYNTRTTFSGFITMMTAHLAALGYKNSHHKDLTTDNVYALWGAAKTKAMTIIKMPKRSTKESSNYAVVATPKKRNVVPESLRCILLDETIKPTQRLRMFEAWFEV